MIFGIYVIFHTLQTVTFQIQLRPIAPQLSVNIARLAIAIIYVISQGTYEWTHANPFTLLEHVCKRSVKFSKLLQDTTNHSSELQFYCDEFTPGNALRTDGGRETMGIYWSVSTLPSWFTNAEWGLFFWGAVPSSVLETIPGGLGQVMRRVLHVCFTRRLQGSFFYGVDLPAPDGSQFNLVIPRLGDFIFDLKAFGQLLGWKGSGSYHCCAICKNVLKPQGQKRLKLTGTANTDFRKAKLADCVFHTGPGLYQIHDQLHRAKATMSTADFKNLEQCMGFRYEPQGLMADVMLRPFWDPVEAIQFDAPHCWIASGGVGQYHTNAFLKVLLSHEVCLERLDQFAYQFHGPHGGGVQHLKDFFSARMTLCCSGAANVCVFLVNRALKNTPIPTSAKEGDVPLYH